MSTSRDHASRVLVSTRIVKLHPHCFQRHCSSHTNVGISRNPSQELVKDRAMQCSWRSRANTGQSIPQQSSSTTNTFKSRKKGVIVLQTHPAYSTSHVQILLHRVLDGSGPAVNNNPIISFVLCWKKWGGNAVGFTLYWKPRPNIQLSILVKLYD